MPNTKLIERLWNPFNIANSFWAHRSLIWQLTKREIISRYRGSFLGIAWTFINPLIMLAVYTFVFSFVFKARWHISTDNRLGFALALFIGLIAHGLLAESLNRAPTLVLSNVNYVKKVVFPLDTLVWVIIGSTLFHTAISMLVWSVFFLLAFQAFHWTALLTPLVFLPLVFYGVGFSWFLSAMGVFFRDISQIIQVLTLVLLFMAPVFYPVTSLPDPYRTWLYLNPLTSIIVEARKVLMLGELPNWPGLALSFLISLCVAWLGFVFFQKVRRGFADVL